MKKLSLILIISNFLALINFAQNSDSGTFGDNITWDFNRETGTLVISGTGEMEDVDGHRLNPPWTHYLGADASELIYHIEIADEITRIGDRNFYRIPNLKTIKMSKNIESIGLWGFGNHDSISTFIIPEKVREIGFYAFAQSNGIKSVVFPASLINIEEGAFNGCYNLTSITNYNPVPIYLYSYYYDPPQLKDLFYGVDKSNCLLRVPKESVELYKESPIWQDFIVVAIEDTEAPQDFNNLIKINYNSEMQSFYFTGIEKNINVKLLDNNGKIVLEAKISPNQSVSTANLAKGMYFVILENKVFKIINN